jgi:16S rRNA (uracil1498-N3)-methyltransferase
MKRARVFAGDAILTPGTALRLAGDESHHLGIVLRARRGQEVEVFNASGALALARVKAASGREVVIDVIMPLEPPREMPYRVILCPSLCKESAWRLILEKSVELGVWAIAPVWSRYSVPELPQGADLDRKRKKWQQTILGAVKQSHRVTVPECRPALPFADAIQNEGNEPIFRLLLYEKEEGRTLSQIVTRQAALIRNGAEIRLFTGPEGGFHPDEVQMAREAGVEICSLGPLVLRAETAAMAALAATHASLGVF